MTRVLGQLRACLPLIPQFLLVVAAFAAMWWGLIVFAALSAPSL